MTILLQWTYYILLHRTRMLLAELMFAMYGNANYEPDGDIILESTQIIPQTDEDCLDLVFDDFDHHGLPRSTGKLGLFEAQQCHLCGRLHFNKISSENLL
ncbi:hypothetical protein AVEN_193367-1 [Araneus ventricosus]|uniref:Uncharacterized protein n=1 Tax=Araneus ventricosus TaxID=182803 RepID=A0A4Y2KWE0_ARAVE|nr:hypothetical protein AVEN_193367-1 [Araneus ventricosus]